MAIVFLDLEQTVIGTWNQAEHLEVGIEGCRLFIQMIENLEGHVQVGLMSWACWNASDKEHFNTRMRPQLEEALGYKFTDRFIWSMDDWCQEVFKHHRLFPSREDLFDLYKKEDVLCALVRSGHPQFLQKQVYLVDDTVQHMMSLHSPANRSRATFVNIWDWCQENQITGP